MSDYALTTGDCIAVMSGMEPDSVDAIVTDPPYGLGFMGKEWDSLPPGKEVAEEMLRVLKPSGYLLSFGGTRTWHRLTCAIEDAGFEIRDTLMWLYGSGFPKSGGALKPAYEPIILARKPGPMMGLGIDECRIPADGESGTRGSCPDKLQLSGPFAHLGRFPFTPHPVGRWPANVVLDEEAADMLDAQAGGLYGQMGPSRFFYCAKASREERNAGCGGSDGVPDGHNLASNICARCGRRVKCNGRGKKCECGEQRVTAKAPRQPNHHPTVKPLALMRWLVRLVARSGETVLDPFAGSGTTGVACMMEGRRFIGIEIDEEYADIARRRIDHVANQGVLTLDV